MCNGGLIVPLTPLYGRPPFTMFAKLRLLVAGAMLFKLKAHVKHKENEQILTHRLFKFGLPIHYFA